MWKISKALQAAYENSRCSLEQGGVSSVAKSLGGERSAPSKSTTTQATCSAPDKTMDTLSYFQSGMTSQLSTADHGADVVMWFLAGFPVRTLVPPAKAQESTESEVDCGLSLPESFARWDHATSSWRTAQCSLLADLDVFSETWPRWGMMRNGVCWARSTPVRRTNANASGFGQNWPSPDARDSQPEGLEAGKRRMEKYSTCGLQTAVNLWPTPNCPNGGRSVKHVTDWRGRTAYHNGKKVQVGLESAVKLWPTPHGFSKDGKSNGPSGNELGRAVNEAQWATPTVNGNYNRKGVSPNSGDGPATQAGGSLNPQFVEWLMGWPINWTSMEPLPLATMVAWQTAFQSESPDLRLSATDRCRPSQPSHGGY
jgi:hypothetical protein